MEFEKFLLQNGSRLFDDADFDMDVWQSFPNANASNHSYLQMNRVVNMDSLRVQLSRRDEGETNVFYLLSQLFSWGQFRLSKDAFQLIVNQISVHPAFLQIIDEFGEKVRPQLPRQSAFLHRAPATPRHRYGNSRRHSGYELFYNLRFVERNGRNRGDPWSLRQTGIYQKYAPDRQHSTWIILQLSKSTRTGLEDMLKAQAATHTSDTHPMSLHPIFLQATASNWSEYVQSLTRDLDLIDEKVCFSNVEPSAKQGYIISFTDMQTLHRLQQKMGRASAMLVACKRAARVLLKHCHDLHVMGFSTDHDGIVKSIETYEADLQTHQQNIHFMVKNLQATLSLVRVTLSELS
ncbi:hypothetical protein P154DRAFT_528198 [Amniculicola lignicola CBS 123094]|uniref:CorA-like transporter domain-containing protein n=1 Tax=Amniculicola lignicola CBS 123094 TaxID=1392246 RepID=A0A6A5VVV5_9PLEO|nr:hypothetical protein P154DRAFT_528198 [Amniculicola lignicola CBS 123094]